MSKRKKGQRKKKEAVTAEAATCHQMIEPIDKTATGSRALNLHPEIIALIADLIVEDLGDHRGEAGR